MQFLKKPGHLQSGDETWLRGFTEVLFDRFMWGLGLGASWDLLSKAATVSATIDTNQGGVTLTGAFPPVRLAVHISHEALFGLGLGECLTTGGKPTSREVELRLYADLPPDAKDLDVGIAWRLFVDSSGYSSDWPWWADNSVSLRETICRILGTEKS